MKKLIIFLLATIFLTSSCIKQTDDKNSSEKNSDKKTETLAKAQNSNAKKLTDKKAKTDKKEVKDAPLVLPEVLAQIKDEKIKKDEVEEEIKRMEDVYRRFGQKLTLKQKEKFAKDILNRLIENKLILTYAKDNNIKANEEEVKKQLEGFKKSFKNEEDLKKFFEKHKLSEEKLIKTLTQRSIKDEVMKKEVVDKIKIDPEKVQKYYEEHKDEFKQKEQVKARHILFKAPRPLPKNATPEQKKDYEAKDKLAKEKAEKLLAEIKKNPKIDFVKLAKEKSEGPSAKKGGELGWFTKERMLKPFAETAFKLKKGEISGIVKTNFGYHIIKVEDRKEARQLTFDEVKKRIEDRLKRKKIRENSKTFKAMLRTKYQVKVFFK